MTVVAGILARGGKVYLLHFLSLFKRLFFPVSPFFSSPSSCPIHSVFSSLLRSGSLKYS